MFCSEEEEKLWIKQAGDDAAYLVIMFDKECREYYPEYIKVTESLTKKLKRLRLSAGMQEVKKVIKL